MIWKYYNLFAYDKQAVFADENLLLVGETFKYISRSKAF